MIAGSRQPEISAIASISTSTSRGNLETSTQDRAGLFVKYWAYTSLKAAKLVRSDKKQVVLITCGRELPAASNTALRFAMAAAVCSRMFSPTTVPSTGERGSCPEV